MESFVSLNLTNNTIKKGVHHEKVISKTFSSNHY